MKSELGFKAMHRRVMEVTGTYTLRGESEPYSANFTAEGEALRPENTLLGMKTLRSLRHSVVRPGAQFGGAEKASGRLIPSIGTGYLFPLHYPSFSLCMLRKTVSGLGRNCSLGFIAVAV